MIDKLVGEGGLELLAEQVDPSARELVEQKVEDKILGNLDLHMHRRRRSVGWDSLQYSCVDSLQPLLWGLSDS